MKYIGVYSASKLMSKSNKKIPTFVFEVHHARKTLLTLPCAGENQQQQNRFTSLRLVAIRSKILSGENSQCLVFVVLSDKMPIMFSCAPVATDESDFLPSNG